ncbi:hypothetical protein FW778_06260 [Ginsengibacter hankyongi]|uniref:Helix-turn-helix domain-containing protein n=1 Tax=Ginsengibacter hankyongi TaxID=2607284 RepID=A0A5J5ILM1_9BACT|nr:excisionase family DNA-binding protein [Ginsengibacter hankyongi]KAA9041621.1 hypothetical protein FW778_06260 [Ginsengibacter hankyongi]
MDNIILSQIPVQDLLALVKQAVREEIVTNSTHSNDTSIDKPVTQAELCKFLGVTEPTALSLRKKGKIPFFLVGTHVRFNIPEVMKALEDTKYKNKKK